MSGPDGESEKFSFTTATTLANRLLKDSVSAAPGEEITLSENIPEGYTVWLAPSGLSAFDETDPKQSHAEGEASAINAPAEKGEYILTAVGENVNTVSQSDAVVTVE